MQTKVLLLVVLALGLGLAQSRRSKGARDRKEKDVIVDPEKTREGKFVSLFNIVTFKNFACSTGQGRTGSCFKSRDCTSKGGRASGACASGFGVCCTFTVNSGTVNQNCTYLQNTGFASSLTTTGNTVTYTVSKCSCNVCRLRLDFQTFNIQGTDSLETGGGTCTDTFTQISSAQSSYPTICGLNTGEHIYVDMGQECSDTATLTFNFGAAAAPRTWDIKATQVECNSVSDPGEGCYQYLTSSSGTIKTFNFDNADQSHLNNQNYQVCIRQNAGFNCVQYLPCTDANANTLNRITKAGITLGRVDSLCTQDFITVQGATATCCAGTNTNMVSRICGTAFTTIQGMLVKGVAQPSNDIPICDCTPPFNLGIRTDATMDIPMNGQSRGICLNYQQIACN